MSSGCQIAGFRRAGVQGCYASAPTLSDHVSDLSRDNMGCETPCQSTPRHLLATASTESSFGYRLPFKALHDFDFLLPPIQSQFAVVSELDEPFSITQQREATHRSIADTYHDMYDLLLKLFGAAHLTTQGTR